MKTLDLLGKILLVTKDSRPQGFQFAINLIDSWSNQVQEKIERRESLELGDLWTWRLLAPERAEVFFNAYPEFFQPGSTAEYEYQLRIASFAWKDLESLRQTCRFLVEHWNDNFRSFYGPPSS